MTKDKTKRITKEKLKTVFTGIVIYLAVLAFSFLFFFAICNALFTFDLIDAKQAVVIILAGTLLCAISFTIYDVHVVKKHGDVRSLFWLKQNATMVSFAIIIVIIICVSLTSKTIWSKEDIKDVISSQWVIFGISITIFVVWRVFVKEYLDKKKTSESRGKQNYREQFKVCSEGVELIGEANTFATTVILLAINVLFLVGATAFCYILNKPEDVFVQNITIISFYLCTNTLINTLFDILRPFLKERKYIKNMNKISKEDFDKLECKANIEQVLEDIMNEKYNNLLKNDEVKALVFDTFKETVDLFYDMYQAQRNDLHKELPQSIDDVNDNQEKTDGDAETV